MIAAAHRRGLSWRLAIFWDFYCNARRASVITSKNNTLPSPVALNELPFQPDASRLRRSC
jgi:hypothetical protein